MAQGFTDQWNFHSCADANDGKHYKIQAPPSSSLYYDYKGTFSIVLIAVVDSNYNILTLELMEAVLTLVCLKGLACTKHLNKTKLYNLSRPQALPNSHQPVHYHLV